ncbi:MAG: hypothetical protein AAFO04_09485 [Cyanobacteria bacterium J06592_8]
MPDFKGRGVIVYRPGHNRQKSTSMSLSNQNAVLPSVLSKYWRMFRIHPASDTAGYQADTLKLAQEFLEHKQLELEDLLSSKGSFEAVLLTDFKAQNSPPNLQTRALAGLCLRCAVSEPILKACQKLENLFGGEKSFTYRDLLPFVLNDDGQNLIVLDQDQKQQLLWQSDDSLTLNPYPVFSVEILQSFQVNGERSRRVNSTANMSLKNWVYFKTKQNSELKKYLSDHGFKKISDWALLNRTRSRQLQDLATRDRLLVEAFHTVYRRDRRQQPKGARKCPDPSPQQLQEMLNILKDQEVIIYSEIQLLQDLKQVAQQLRQYDVWNSRQPLEVYNCDSEKYEIRSDIHPEPEPLVEIEQREIREFLYEQLESVLLTAIQQEIQQKLAKLKKSRKYADKADQFIPGLRLYYIQGMSLKEIAPVLGMTSWDQARRILNPGELLNKVRTLTVQNLLEQVLQKAQKMGLTSIPPKAEYLNRVIQAIEAFADQEIFQVATEEMRTGKNRSFNSLYAQHLRACLSELI